MGIGQSQAVALGIDPTFKSSSQGRGVLESGGSNRSGGIRLPNPLPSRARVAQAGTQDDGSQFGSFKRSSENAINQGVPARAPKAPGGLLEGELCR